MKILFLCTGNSCRSQMAEGWAKHCFPEQFEIHSAGTKTHGLNPNAVKVMAESGINISGHHSKTLDDLKQLGHEKFDLVITVCSDAHETCPVYFGHPASDKAPKIVHQGFDDPPYLANLLPKDLPNREESELAIYRRVRDEIKDYIEKLKQQFAVE